MASVTAPPLSGTVAGPVRRNYGRLAELTWIWTIVGYSVLRFGIAWGAFAEHGANVWVFGLIDVGTAWPYAKSVATVCKRAASNDWKSLPLPLAVASATFFAPYGYLWFAAGEMPAGMRVAMALCVAVLLTAATAGALVKTRKLRNEASAVAIDLREVDPTDEIIIDLTGEEARLERRPATAKN